MAQLVDSGLNRKILHDSRRLLLPGIRHLYRLVALKDNGTSETTRSLARRIPISCLESPGRLGVYSFATNAVYPLTASRNRNAKVYELTKATISYSLPSDPGLLLLSLIAVEVGASSKGGLNFGLPKLPFKGKKRGRAGKRREEISVSAAGGDVTRPPITVIVNWAVSRSRHSGKRTSLAAALRMNTWVLAVPR